MLLLVDLVILLNCCCHKSCWRGQVLFKPSSLFKGIWALIWSKMNLVSLGICFWLNLLILEDKTRYGLRITQALVEDKLGGISWVSSFLWRKGRSGMSIIILSLHILNTRIWHSVLWLTISARIVACTSLEFTITFAKFVRERLANIFKVLVSIRTLLSTSNTSFAAGRNDKNHHVDTSNCDEDTYENRIQIDARWDGDLCYDLAVFVQNFCHFLFHGYCISQRILTFTIDFWAIVKEAPSDKKYNGGSNQPSLESFVIWQNSVYCMALTLKRRNEVVIIRLNLCAGRFLINSCLLVN